ncbi:hypothetical protein EYC84_004939 [Monilinia fructicola]|uniref:PIN domain-containing protein n=1 Tax=Monilinia fructicola TaxID=38448 RepID=A0A5M9K2T2_MONFR|nr:hypothetical protein EYC84_004939 [Monilinia fructicola]
MGKAAKTRKFGAVKRVIGQRDARLKENKDKGEEGANKPKELVREAPQVSSALFFQYNEALVPPYSILIDTNFLSHTVQRKLPLLENPHGLSLRQIYRIALRIARDERWQRLQCDHKGVYADDCIVDRVQKHKIYIVATNDRELKRRVRKVPGVPIMSVARGKYVIERLPDAPEK